MTWPTVTLAPTSTRGRLTRWQYRLTTSEACRTSMYQPQPVVLGEPSTSQVGVDALQRTVTTVPSAIDLISVPLRCERSTPSCVGRDGVRKPPIDTFGTGMVHWPVSVTLSSSGAIIGASSDGAGAGGGGGGQTGIRMRVLRLM